ncbi:MAG: hypothetical protein KDA42_05080 [Planctomycetales bacterium]|nr:hypothetical protein [Planctomycetales bacterium]
MRILSQRSRKARPASTVKGRCRLGSEMLENRIVLTASSAGFVVDGADLYYEVVGIDTADTIKLYTDISGDSNIDVTNADGMSSHSVSAGDIANAQLMTSKAYAGVRIRSLGGDDFVDAKMLTGDKVHVLGGDGMDLIYGSPNMDVLEGGDMDDIIFGGAQMDVLKGQGGDDYLDGEAGPDEIRGGGGDDTVIADAEDTDAGKTLAGGGGTDKIDFSGSGPGVGFMWMGCSMDGINYKNNGFERIVGSKYDDLIDNSAFTSGDLRVWARAGDDVILSSPGADLIDGQAGNDWISYEKAASGVNVDLTLTVQSDPGSEADGDELRSIENLTGSEFDDVLTGDNGDNAIKGLKGRDDLFGGRGDDILLGGDQGDRLFGELGNDYLDGGAGRDRIYGGTGVDTAVVNWERDVTGAHPDQEIFLGGEVDTVLYEKVFSGSPLSVDLSKVNDNDDFLNDLHDDNKSDFDEGVDNTEWYDVVPDPLC